MEPKQPELITVSLPIFDDQGESTAYLSLLNYENAIQAALYDKSPRLGSMSLSYPVLNRVEQQMLFQGKHEQLSRALGMLLCRKFNIVIYASVNLSEYAQVTPETIKKMLQLLEESG